MLGWARASIIEAVAAERAAYRVVSGDIQVVARDAIGDNIRGILESLRQVAETFAASAEARARSGMAREATRHMRRWVGTIRVQTRVDVAALVSEADMVDLLSLRGEEYARLIRNVSEDVRDRIARETIRAVTEGRSNEAIAKSLAEIEGIGRGRAKLIARDQASKLNAAMNEFRQRQAGVTKYTWRSMMDPPRAREDHMDRDGKVFEWANPPADGHPGHAINCRCRALAILGEDRERAGRGGALGDPVDLAAHAGLMRTVGGTMGEDVMFWPRKDLLARQGRVRQARGMVVAAQGDARVLERHAADLFRNVFGFEASGVDLGRISGSRLSAFARRRTLLFNAVLARLDAVDDLLDHALLTARN